MAASEQNSSNFIAISWHQLYRWAISCKIHNFRLLQGPGLTHRNILKPKIALTILLACLFVPSMGQNCDVDFPGTAARNFSNVCGGASTSNLTLGKNTYIGNGDTFTFDAPAVININGNLDVNAQGSGKIIIPAGVTVNVDGNFQLDPKNSGCTPGNPCVFEIVVNGHANFTHNFQNNLVTLIWSGTGTVVVDDHFKNSSNGCMDCGAGGCPDFDVNSSDCDDDGSGCSGGDFCAQINACSSDVTVPEILSCPANKTVNILGQACTQTVTWTTPTASDNCNLSSFSASQNPGTEFPLGTTTVTYTARDAAGNIATCSFDITVVDHVAPVITGCPEDITLEGNEQGVARAEWALPTAVGQCGETTLTSSHQPGDIFSIGNTVIEYRATDEAGNISYCHFNVSVSQIEIGIGKIITPDGNGVNDVWTLANIEKYNDNKVVIVDRWGGLIFTATGYNNQNVIWQGTNRSGGLVPTGTYFYKIFVRAGAASLVKSGFIELIRE